MQNRHYWIIVALAILAALLLTLWFHNIAPAGYPAPMLPVSTSKSSGNSTSKPDINVNRVAVATSSASSQQSSLAGGGKEICGIGVFDSAPDNLAEIQKQLEDKAQHVWQDLKDALISSDDVAARATGLYLSGTGAADTPGGFDKNLLEQLVQLAVDSSDPAAYGIAYQACDRASKMAINDVCRKITARDWAERDAGNAVPWLLIAAQQDSNGQKVGAIKALQQATEASRIDSYGDMFASKANWLKPADLSPLMLNQLEMNIFVNQAAWNILQLGPVHQFCLGGKTSLTGDLKKQYCSKLGRLLVDHGTSAIELGIGRKLGEQSGWSKAETDQLKELLTAMQSTFSSMTLTSLDCKSLEQVNNYFMMRAELGERGAAQFMVDHSGKLIDELATQYREQSKQRR